MAYNIDMTGFTMMLLFLLLPTFFILLVIIIVLQVVYNGDRFQHPEEYADKGKEGERIIYRTLVDQIHVPENQILRNVYVPTANSKTSEIDLLVISKKGILLFECKNYAGNIYGDAKRNKWIQYLGKKKSYFYNPFMQNRSHVKHLKKYLEKYGDIPMIPMVTTITGGKWKVKNYGPEDYLLGYNCHLVDILARTPDSELMAQHFRVIMAKLQPLSRPDETVRQEHINQIRRK